MVRLVKYLKPFLLLILIAIGLLFIQANADLALPDYLSRIVNTGIQQGGVDSAVPLALRASQMERILIFIPADQRPRVLEAYSLVDTSSPEAGELQATYPELANQPVYVRKALDAEQIEQLNLVLGPPIVIVSQVEQMQTDPAKAEAMAKALNFDLSRLPQNMDWFGMLAKLPAAQIEQMTGAVLAQFGTLDSSMVVQAAAAPIRAEYEALGMDANQVQTSYILRTGGMMLLFALIGVVCTIGVGYLSAKVGSGLARDLRQNVFKKVESFSNAEFDQFSTASLITRSTNDINQIQMLVIMLMRMVVYAPIIGVGGIIRALSMGSSMWWIIALAVVVLMALVFTVFSLALPKFRVVQKLIDRLNLVMREDLSGMMVIRAFNRQEFELKRFHKANQDLTDTMLFISRIMVIMMPLMMLIMNGLSLTIIWVGSHQVAQAQMQVGDMMAFMQYAMQIVFSFLMLSMMFIILPRAEVSADRIADVLETQESIHDPQQPQRLPDAFRGTVEFRDVSFRYPGAEEDVLHDISFTARPGQTTAFIGSTGSGKSTVINLIPRFYDVTEGAILIDGVDIRQVTQHDLRDKIGYVPQKGTLFSGTIESNLRYADEAASEARLRQAVEIAQASEFIDSKPEGLATEIAQGGMNVSGGQKQRLSIARALVKQPPIYIFDDSFSALDFKTDAALRRALKAQTKDSTILVVTQRVSTIKNADQIIVLDEGRVAGKGSHRELMQTCEAYREIALSQLSMEELA